MTKTLGWAYYVKIQAGIRQNLLKIFDWGDKMHQWEVMIQ